MRCIYCGKEIPSLYPFSMCPTCGQPIEAQPAAAGSSAVPAANRSRNRSENEG